MRLVDRIRQYLIPYSEKYSIPQWKLWGGVIWNCVINRCSVRDYFTLGFPFLNRRGKKTFVTATECTKFYHVKNDKKQAAILDNKEEMLHYFDAYVARDWCAQTYNCTAEKYQLFETKHEKCIVKPMTGSGGHGIHIVNCAELDGGLYEYCKRKNAVAEELIVQHPVLCQIYSHSVNTIRVFTYNTKVIGAVLRIGQGGAKIDNASSGGIFAPIDITTGIVTSGAFDFNLSEVLVVHPDTKKPIPGICIPYWGKCKTMVEATSTLLEGLPLIGWDVAITENGPILVEANCEPEIPLLQIPAKYGIRNVLKI